MCADPAGIIVKTRKGHAGSEARVFDAARPLETPEAKDPEREKQAQADEGSPSPRPEVAP